MGDRLRTVGKGMKKRRLGQRERERVENRLLPSPPSTPIPCLLHGKKCGWLILMQEGNTVVKT